jgi:regulator of protease activity HflC (stomatin/prohibitin superfamily)
MTDILVGRPQSDVWSHGRAWLERRRRGVMLVLLVLMFVITALAPRIFITIPSGHGGILWMRFFGGTQTDRAALGEGLHVIFPWDHIFIYDMRVQEREQSYEVIAREGLQVTVRSSFRWQLNRSVLPRLHKEIGPNYLEVLIVPEIGSVLREVIAKYDIEQLFSSRRTEIQREILQAVISDNPGAAPNRIGGRTGLGEDSEDFVTLTDILLKDVVLPFRLRSAIERKLEQAQISQEYTFRIQREKLESERKLIEAQGIQAFQQTVQAGISDAYLKWRGIEATLQLATSPNAKVVVVGGGSHGMPLILNTDDARPSQPAAPAPPSAAPASLQKARNIDDDQQAGSINTTPPASNTSFEARAAAEEEERPQGGEEQAVAAPLAPKASGLLDEIPRSDEPPYILRSFADAFGYRLQPSVPPASASVVGPNERPR